MSSDPPPTNVDINIDGDNYCHYYDNNKMELGEEKDDISSSSTPNHDHDPFSINFQYIFDLFQYPEYRF